VQEPGLPGAAAEEDLRVIAAAVAEAGELIITCDNYEATSPEDFDNLPVRPSRVAIMARRPAARSVSPELPEPTATSKPGVPVMFVVLSGLEATVEMADPDTLMTGVLQRIRLVCEKRRRRLASVVPPQPPRPGRQPQSSRSRPVRRSWWLGNLLQAGLLLSVVALLVLAFAASLTPKQPFPAGPVIGIGASFAVFALGMLATGVLVRRPRVVIINDMRVDRPTYWQRTRDIWQVGIATATLGAIVGYVLGKFT
jgi:hypothetical protein